MDFALSPQVREQALAQLIDGNIVTAVHTLHQAGAGIAQAKAWVDGLAASADPLEAAVGKACQAAQRDYQATRQLPAPMSTLSPR
jgi:hypothetical protein